MTIGSQSLLRRRTRAQFGAAVTVSLLVVVAACSSSGSKATRDHSGVASVAPGADGVPSSAAGTASPPNSSARPVPVESNPPGDIPDNVAFVSYTSGAGRYAFTHPEGWERTENGPTVRFTDKLNGLTATSLVAVAAPTGASARSADVPRLARAVPAFELRSVSEVSLPAGKAVRIVFRRNSDPDPVTARVYRDEVEEYEVFGHGRLVRLDLFGPVGADNVDAYRTITMSLRIT